MRYIASRAHVPLSALSSPRPSMEASSISHLIFRSSALRATSLPVPFSPPDPSAEMSGCRGLRVALFESLKHPRRINATTRSRLKGDSSQVLKAFPRRAIRE